MSILNIFRQTDAPRSYEDPGIRNVEIVLNKWLQGKERAEQLLAEKYYDGDHDILQREKMVIGVDGNLTAVNNVINNKLVDNQYRKLVDQKTNYALGKPLTIAAHNQKYLNELNQVFGRTMHRKIRVLARYAVDGGIAWMHPFYNEDGSFDTMIFPAHEICPIWKDKMHTKLECVIRYYPEEVFLENGETTIVFHADVFRTTGIDHYLVNGRSLVPAEKAHTEYVYIGDTGYNWERLPMIPFKYNDKEIPLIRNVKSLQDALNEVISDFQNNMQEDPRTSIIVLKNYDGTNIPEFRQNLATYGVVKVTTVDGVQGGVDVMKVEVNAANYQAILMQLKRAIVENGRGFDAKEERMDGDPNQMNIESMYTDIDLDVNGMETEFQAGFEELKWFIDRYLDIAGKGDFSEEPVEFIFNRDIFINEDAKIENVVKSVGILSEKTLLSRHPWVTDVELEMTQISEDRERELQELSEERTLLNEDVMRDEE